MSLRLDKRRNGQTDEPVNHHRNSKQNSLRKSVILLMMANNDYEHCE